jgi:hypothetical protein
MVSSTFLTEDIISSIYNKDIQLGNLCREDSNGAPGNTDFEKKDLPLYSVLLNCYFLILEDRIVNTEKRIVLLEAVTDYLKHKGLFAYIKESDEFFSMWVKETEIPTHPIFSSLLETILSTDYQDLLGSQVAGEIFRFMKRFSPYGTVGLAAKCAQDFWDNEYYNKGLDQLDHPYGSSYWFVTKYIREKTKHLFRFWDNYEDMFTADEADVDNAVHERVGDYYGHMFLSPNAIQCTCNSQLCKRILLESEIGDTLNEGKGFPNPYLSLRSLEEINNLSKTGYKERFNYYNSYVGSDFVTGNPVPKKFDSDRMVAPDRVVGYHEQMKTERKLRQVILDNKIAGEELSLHTPIEDQSLQRMRAQQGSIDGEIDTLDFSSASDLHRKVVVRELYPNDIAKELLSNVPKGIVIGKVKKSLSMFAPMGSPLTFRTMQMTLFMVLYAATMFCASIFNWSLDRTLLALRRIGVFGDDVTCDHEVTEIFVSWVTLLGFKVNLRKSYTEKGRNFTFREACGGDYINGVDVSAHYWPRKQFQVGKKMLLFWHVDGFTSELDDSLSVLINLSKSIRKFSERAAIYLNSICRKIEPKLTMSEVGSSNPDLWSSVILNRPKFYSPYSSVKEDDIYYLDYRRYERKEGLRVSGSSSRILATSKIRVKEDYYRRKLEEYKEFCQKPVVLQHLEYDKPITHPFALRRGTNDMGLVTLQLCKKDRFRTTSTNQLSYLEARAVPQAKPAQLKLRSKEDTCIVESVLHKHGINVQELLEYYAYLDFLEKGVYYASDLDRLLGITSRRDPNQLFGTPTINWVLSVK